MRTSLTNGDASRPSALAGARGVIFESKGQAIVELILSVVMISAGLFACASIFRLEWQRLRCSHQAFEKTRERLFASHDKQDLSRGFGSERSVSKPLLFNRLFSGQFSESETSITGVFQCGSLTEKLTFKKLNDLELE